MATSVSLLTWWKQECWFISLISFLSRLSFVLHATTKMTSFVVCWEQTWINKVDVVLQRYILLLAITTLTPLGCYCNAEQVEISRMVTVTHQLIMHVGRTTKNQLVYCDNIRWALLTNSLITCSCFTLHYCCWNNISDKRGFLWKNNGCMFVKSILI